MINITLLVLGMGVLFVLSALIYWGAVEAKREQANKLAMFGVNSKAIVTKKIRETGLKGSVFYYVDYQFNVIEADGKSKSYTAVQRVGLGMYQLLAEDMEVTIRYIPDEPTATARLSGLYADETRERQFILSGMAWFIIPGIMLVVLIASSQT